MLIVFLHLIDKRTELHWEEVGALFEPTALCEHVHRSIYLVSVRGHGRVGAQLQEDLEKGVLVGFVDVAGCWDQVRGYSKGTVKDFLVVWLKEVWGND